MVADPVSIPRLVFDTNANGKGWIYGGVNSPEYLIEALMSLSKDSKVPCNHGRAVIYTRQKPTADVSPGVVPSIYEKG